MVTSETKELFKGSCDRCGMKSGNRRYALVVSDNGYGVLEDIPELRCFECIKKH